MGSHNFPAEVRMSPKAFKRFENSLLLNGKSSELKCVSVPGPQHLLRCTESSEEVLKMLLLECPWHSEVFMETASHSWSDVFYMPML